MTARIHILPVTRRFNAPAPELPCDCEPALPLPDYRSSLATRVPKATQVPYETNLDLAIANKLEDAAEKANCDPSEMIEAMIVYCLAEIEKKPVAQFLFSSAMASSAEERTRILKRE